MQKPQQMHDTQPEHVNQCLGEPQPLSQQIGQHEYVRIEEPIRKHLNLA